LLEAINHMGHQVKKRTTLAPEGWTLHWKT
jgi:hypothetical protein